jgi:hypothetical protein
VSRFSLAINTEVFPATEQKLRVFPNPATEGILVIESNEFRPGSVLSILSADGNTVKTIRIQQIESSEIIDITDFNPGIYIIILSKQGLNAISKFIIL